MKTLRTLGTGRAFTYGGSVADGTDIHYGEASKALVSKEQYSNLLANFSKKEIPIGPPRTIQPKGSLGEWLVRNVTQTAIASYVAPILKSEGYVNAGAKRGWIKFCESHDIPSTHFSDTTAVPIVVDSKNLK